MPRGLWAGSQEAGQEADAGQSDRAAGDADRMHAVWLDGKLAKDDSGEMKQPGAHDETRSIG